MLKDRDLLPGVQDRLTKALMDKDCKKVFTGKSGYDPLAVLNDYLGGSGQYGQFYFGSLGNGIGAETVDLGKKKANIIVNNSTDSGTIYWNYNFPNLNTLTLLHELGHALNFIFGNGATKIRYDVNRDGSVNLKAQEENRKALEPCDKALSAAGFTNLN